MSQISEKKVREAGDRQSAELRRSPMMAHLLDALESGADIGHFGRLVFVMVARFFLDEEDVVAKIARQPEMDEAKARALVLQVNEKDYNPPKRDRILEWQAQQQFPICPNPEEPNACNVYRELRFPEHVYDQIEEFWEEKVEGESKS